MDSVVHLITKRDWQFYDRHKAGERNLKYPNGTKFNPYLHIVCCIYSPKYVRKHIRENETTYYTSGRKGLGLLYLDVDAHHPWFGNKPWERMPVAVLSRSMATLRIPPRHQPSG